MLKGIPAILSPELLKALCEMGHGETLVIADGNFPAHSVCPDSIILRADGHGTAEMLDAVLKVVPLDAYTDAPVTLMEVLPGDTCPIPTIWGEYREVLQKNEPEHCGITQLQRYDFYDRARKAHVVICTGETAIYANILLQKGIV